MLEPRLRLGATRDGLYGFLIGPKRLVDEVVGRFSGCERAFPLFGSPDEEAIELGRSEDVQQLLVALADMPADRVSAAKGSAVGRDNPPSREKPVS